MMSHRGERLDSVGCLRLGIGRWPDSVAAWLGRTPYNIIPNCLSAYRDTCEWVCDREGCNHGGGCPNKDQRFMMQFDESSPDDISRDEGSVAIVRPKRARQADREKNRQPRFHVVLWDSDDHTFDYVHRMLRELFGHTQQQCEKIAESVDSEGRAIVLTTTKEHAELKRDQIHAYGKDHIEMSQGSMFSTIEPES